MLLRLTFCLFFLTFFALCENSDSLLNHAITLYETRHLHKENLKTSFEILSKIVAKEPNNLRALCEFSKVCYLMGDNEEKKDEKLNYYSQGMKYAKKAISLHKNSPWAHFWYLVNLGRSGQTRGVLNSLGLVPEIKKEIEKVLKLDPKHAGAMDAYAMFYYELPPLIGGNLNKSIEYLNRALEIDSNYTILYVDMAKVYIKKKEYDKAQWSLNKLMEIKKPTYLADYILHDRPEAERLLREIQNVFHQNKILPK